MIPEIYTCAICHEDGTFMPFSIMHGKKNKFVTLLCSSMCCSKFRELEICVRTYMNTMRQRRVKHLNKKLGAPIPHPEMVLNLVLERELKFDMLPPSVLWTPYKNST